MSDLIDRQELLRQIDIDADGEPGYYGDTWKFIDTIKNMPSATDISVGDKLGTNLAEVGTDAVSRKAVKELAYSQIRSMYCGVALKEQRETMLRIADNVIGLLAPVTSAEPKRGKWKIKKATIHPYGNDVCCSICGHTMGSTFGYKFCPNCGAKMEVTE